MDVQSEIQNPIVFLDFKIQDYKVGRVVLELYTKCAPRTCENFLALCTGKGVNRVSGQALHFKGSIIDRVIPDLLLQAGNIKNQDGSSGGTIYGPVYTEENYQPSDDLKFTNPSGGILALVNKLETPKKNTSHFFITADACPHLEGLMIAFGKVLKGLNVIREICNDDGMKDNGLEIGDCGEIRDVEHTASDDEDYPFEPREWVENPSSIASGQVEKAVERMKEVGNAYFKRKEFYIAQKKYRKAVRYINWAEGKTEGFVGREQRTLCVLNLTATRLNLKRYREAYSLCSEVIKLKPSVVKPNLVKAYFRRAQASFGLSDYKSALTDLKKAQELEPSNGAIRREIKKVEKAIGEHYEKEKKMCVLMMKE